MATTIHEFFGYHAMDLSSNSRAAARDGFCPHIADHCDKTLGDGTTAGVCSLKPATRPPVICCPSRLYTDGYRILRDISTEAFGPGLPLVRGGAAAHEARTQGSEVVAVFGKRWGGELRLPKREGVGSYFVDWILAHLDPDGELIDFVAVEVQSIDTTGNYRDARRALLEPERQLLRSSAGFNWENVNKRILPQLIYKGNVLQREQRCTKGLFFVTPTPVYQKIVARLGGELLKYPLQSGSITFLAYDLETQDGKTAREGNPLELKLTNRHTTSVVQVAQAFVSPSQMPDEGVYEEAILTALR